MLKVMVDALLWNQDHQVLVSEKEPVYIREPTIIRKTRIKVGQSRF